MALLVVEGKDRQLVSLNCGVESPSYYYYYHIDISHYYYDRSDLILLFLLLSQLSNPSGHLCFRSRCEVPTIYSNQKENA